MLPVILGVGTTVKVGNGGEGTMMSELVYGSSLSVLSELISNTTTVYSPGSELKHCLPVVSDPFNLDALNVRTTMLLKFLCSE